MCYHTIPFHLSTLYANWKCHIVCTHDFVKQCKVAERWNLISDKLTPPSRLTQTNPQWLAVLVTMGSIWNIFMCASKGSKNRTMMKMRLWSISHSVNNTSTHFLLTTYNIISCAVLINWTTTNSVQSMTTLSEISIINFNPTASLVIGLSKLQQYNWRQSTKDFAASKFKLEYIPQAIAQK